MNLKICLFFLFLLGTEIIARDEDLSAEKVILRVNSLLSKMVTSNNLATYKNLSSEALKITQEYFKYEKASAVPGEEEKTTSKEINKPARNSTEEKLVDKDGTRRHTFIENDPNICYNLTNNIRVALIFIEANFHEMKKHLVCTQSQSVRGQQNKMSRIKAAIDLLPLDEESGTNNPELKSDLIILSSVFAPGFIPTPSQIQRLETILKRPVFGNILQSNPDLCYGSEPKPQVSIQSEEKIPIWPGKLESGNKNQYFNPQRPLVLDPYSKYQTVIQEPDTLDLSQNSKAPLWPLSLTAKEMPLVDLNKMLQIIPNTEFTSQNLNPAPLLTSTPISDKLWKILNQITSSKHTNSDQPRLPLLFPTSGNTLNEREKLKLFLNVLGKKSIYLPLNFNSIPYKENIDFPVTKKPIHIPPPFLIDAQPLGNYEISKLYDLPKDKPPKYGGDPYINKASNSPTNKPLGIPIDAVPLWPKKPMDVQKNPFQPQLFDKYPIHLNRPQVPDDPEYPMKKNMKYPPSLINTPYNSQKYIANDDLPQPDLISQILGKDVKPHNEGMYYSNLQKIPLHDLELFKKYPEILPKEKNAPVYLPPLLYLKPKHNNNEFIIPKKIKINEWPYQRPTGLVNYPKDKILHKDTTTEYLYEPHSGNRGDFEFDDRIVSQKPSKYTFGDSFKHNQPVEANHGPLPLTFGKENIDYYDDVKNVDQDDKGSEIPYIINELQNKGKRPYDHNSLPTPNDVIYPKHMRPFIENEYLDDRDKNPLIKNVEDKTTPLPWNSLSKDLYSTSPINYYNDKFSPINSNLPLDLTFSHIKQKTPIWPQTPNSYLDGFGLEGLLNKNIGQNYQYNQNPFKNSYQIYDLLNKTPQELLQSGGGTNWIKFATKPSQTEVELIFLMKAQEPIIYWPIYYLSYRMPTIKLIKKFKTTAENKPIISSTDHILYELINSEPYLTISPELKKMHKEDLYRLLVNNGLVVAANIYKNNQKINREDYLIAMDKILNNPGNYEIKSKYFRSGPVRSEDFSENTNFDKNLVPASLNNDLGRRLFPKYYYNPRTYKFRSPPAVMSPAILKLQAQKRLRAIKALQRLQGERDALYYTLKSRQNHTLIGVLNDLREKPSLKNAPKYKSPKSDVQTINSNSKSDDKGTSQKDSDVSQAETTTVFKAESKEDLTVKGLYEKDVTARLFAANFDADLKNSTDRADFAEVETHEVIHDTADQDLDRMDVETTSKLPIDDFLLD